MKASELSSLYERGKRDFSGQNLVNQKFDHQQLPGIDLSHADIRGASFAKADLTGADFRSAKAGSTLIVTLIRTTFQLIVAVLAMSFAVIYCAEIFETLGKPDDPDHLSGLGLGLTWGISFIPSLFFLVFSSKWIAKNFSIVVSSYFVTSFLISIIMVSLRAGLSPLEDVGLYLRLLIANIFLFLLLFFPLISLVATTANFIVQSLPYRSTWASTSFRGANLTGADFSKAALGNTSFRAAQIESTCFYQAKNLNTQLFEETFLTKPKLLARAVTTPKNDHH